MIDSARAIASQSKAVARFVALYDDLREKASLIPLSHLIQEIVESSGYRARLEAIGDDEAQSRIENLVELQAVASQYNLAGDTHLETIGAFLDKAALSSSADLPRDEQGQSAGAVSLTTLHLAKGLEFPIVFLTGLEEGLIPHYRSLEDPAAIEEERRLCYVGITRAMKKLFLTRCVHREMFSAGSGFGSTGSYRLASRFLRDIPSEVVEAVTERSVLNAARYEEIEIDDAGFRPSRLSTKSATSGFPGGQFEQGASQRAVRPQWSPNKTAGNTAKAAAKSLVQSADTIEQTDSRPLLAPDELSVSLRVFHPSFGAGTVTKIDGDLEKKPKNVRVTVVFDNNNEAKKLLLQFARLRAL
jgi:ATP-dependent exoDNAse (exonuclease V) beta subunit